MPNGLPLSILALVALLVASFNPEVDQRLETIASVVQKTKEAIRNIRQGIESLNQGVTELRRLRG